MNLGLKLANRFLITIRLNGYPCSELMIKSTCETTAQLLSFCGHTLRVYQQNKMLVPHKSTTPAWVAFSRGGEKDDKCKTVSMKMGLAFFIASQEILTSSIA